MSPVPRSDDPRLLRALARLASDGLVRVEDERRVATRRWHGAMARAAVRLMGTNDDGADLRVPVASALVELYGPELPEEDLADMVEVLLPIESVAVEPGAGSIPDSPVR